MDGHLLSKAEPRSPHSRQLSASLVLGRASNRSFLAILALMAICDVRVQASEPDRAAIRRTLKAWWDSLDTIEFNCFESKLDAKGDFHPGGGGLRYEFSQAAGGRRVLVVRQVMPDESSFQVENQRDDGKKTYIVQPFVDHPGSFSKLNILNQASSHIDYQGTMFSALSIFMPGGKPLWRWLDDPATEITRRDRTDGEDVIVTFKHRGRKNICKLDPHHDWLPREVKIETDPPFTTNVSRFGKDGGHWFPTAGTSTSPSTNKTTQEMGFAVSGLKINRPIPAGSFSPPEIPEGAILSDTTDPQRQRIYSRNPHLTPLEIGELRGRYQSQYVESKVGAPSGVASPLEAHRDPPRFPWTITLGVGATSMIILSAVLRFRMRGGTSKQGRMPNS